MKICIPTETGSGLKTAATAHFGSAPFFTIYDTDSKTCEIIDNSDREHMHGMCQPLSVLADKNIDIIICGGMGARAVEKLTEAGIKAYRASDGTAEDILSMLINGTLEEITFENACIQHTCS